MWTDAARATFEPMTVRTPVRGPFHGRVWRHELGPLTVSRLAADTSVVARTPALIRASDLERFELGVQLRGGCIVSQGDRRAVLEPGTISTWHSSRPYTVDARTPFELLLVYCPDPLVQPHLDHLLRRTALAVPAERGPGRVLAGLLALLVEELEGGTLTCAEHDIADSVLSLVRALHRDRDPGRHSSRRSSATLREAIKATIDERLGDPGLRPDALARDHHISRSYLDRLFAAEGTSVGAWIRARRPARPRRPRAGRRDDRSDRRALGVHEPRSPEPRVPRGLRRGSARLPVARIAVAPQASPARAQSVAARPPAREDGGSWLSARRRGHDGDPSRQRGRQPAAARRAQAGARRP